MERDRQKTGGIFGAAHDEDIERTLYRLLWAAVGVVLLTTVVEFAMFFVIRSAGMLVQTSRQYYFQYIFLPIAMNGVPVAAAFVIRRKNLTLRAQAYATTLLFAWISFVLYTVHLQFSALVLCFALPILMTIVFGDILMTTVVSAITLLLKMISDVFIVWDTAYTLKRLATVNDKINFWISIIVLGVVYALSVITITLEENKHKRLAGYELERLRLYRESLSDALTGLMNRKGLQISMQYLPADADETVHMMAMVDMDHFKEINDTYGHPVGDRYLKTFGDILSAVPSAEGFRFGGNEFCLLLHGYDREQAERCCREIQKTFRESEVCRTVEEMTVSFGIAAYAPSMTPSDLIRRADDALYRAKQARGSVVYCGAQEAAADKAEQAE